jgi:hypothetical protein
MDNDERLEDITIDKKSKGKNKFPITIILHGKKITSGVIVCVMITIFSSAILGYFFPDIDYDENTIIRQISTKMEETKPNYQNEIMNARLYKIFTVIAPLQRRILLYYQMRGKFPTKKEVHLDSLDLNEYDSINSSDLTDKGGIAINLSKEFGDDKYILFQPIPSTHGAFFKWRCTTNMDEKFLGLPPYTICEYQNNGSSK